MLTLTLLSQGSNCNEDLAYTHYMIPWVVVALLLLLARSRIRIPRLFSASLVSIYSNSASLSFLRLLVAPIVCKHY